MIATSQANTSSFPYLERPVKIGDQEWDIDLAPLVSISCITYNHEEVISQALEGFLMQQTTFKVEVLVHDDASSDRTAEIISTYEKKYPQIFKVIYQKENQYSKKVKIGYHFQYPRVNGKYYATCEGDDYWIDPLKLQKQISLLEKNPDIGACFTNALYLNEIDGTETSYASSLESGVVPTNLIFQKGGSIYPTASIVLRKEFLDDPVFVQVPELAGDELLIFSIASKSKVYFLNERTSVYRRWSGGVYSSIAKNKEKLVAYKMKDIKGYLKFDRYSQFKFTTLLKAKISKNSLYIVKNSRRISERLKYLRYLTFRQFLSLFMS